MLKKMEESFITKFEVMVAFVIAVALVTLLYFAVTKNKKTFAIPNKKRPIPR